jgi:hypothetical protein
MSNDELNRAYIAAQARTAVARSITAAGIGRVSSGFMIVAICLTICAALASTGRQGDAGIGFMLLAGLAAIFWAAAIAGLHAAITMDGTGTLTHQEARQLLADIDAGQMDSPRTDSWPRR